MKTKIQVHLYTRVNMVRFLSVIKKLKTEELSKLNDFEIFHLVEVNFQEFEDYIQQLIG